MESAHRHLDLAGSVVASVDVKTHHGRNDELNEAYVSAWVFRFLEIVELTLVGAQQRDPVKPMR
jgi:hypothetical protein